MEGNQRKYNSQVEINNLVGDAVKNVVARRSQALDSEDTLSALSDEEARSIAGGQIGPILPDYITPGLVSYPDSFQ